MVSKKILGPTLAGTGAVGATGSLAWALGLFDGEDLEEVAEKAPGAQKVQASANVGSPEPPKIKPPRAITYVSGTYFTGTSGASNIDRKVINSKLNLKVEWNKGLLSIIVNAEGVGEENSWKCRLKAISIEEIKSEYDLTGFERQKAELEKELENDDHKKQFVANCSYTRLEGEKVKGEDSTIELETEKAGGWDKFKFKESEGYFKRLWTEDFYGIDRIKKEDEWFLDKENANGWEIKTVVENKTKIKITATLKKNNENKEWKCNISKDSSRDPGEKTFKDEKLEEILKLSTLNSGILEKKKYLIRNCAKNKGEIKGLKIKVDRSNWKFDEDGGLKKIIEGMYENPTET